MVARRNTITGELSARDQEVLRASGWTPERPAWDPKTNIWQARSWWLDEAWERVGRHHHPTKEAFERWMATRPMAAPYCSLSRSLPWWRQGFWLRLRMRWALLRARWLPRLY